MIRPIRALLAIAFLAGGAALTISVILPMRRRLLRERKSAERGTAATTRTADPEDAAHGLHQ